MSLSIAESILAAAQLLRKAGVTEARREAGSLLAHIIGSDRSFIISHAQDHISEQDLQRFREVVERRAQGEPLQYITGNQEFFGLDFEVNKDVLIPRPETELLVQEALQLVHPDAQTWICDIGTGSGCIAVTLLHERRRALAVATDISQPALLLAQRNAARHAVADRVALVASDCFAALSRTPRFDLIVSNPPYVPSNTLAGLQREVRDYEPRVALTPGADGLSIIRQLLEESGDFLKKDGYLLFEIGFDQGAVVRELIDVRAWNLLDIHQDLQGIPRTVALQKLSS